MADTFLIEPIPPITSGAVLNYGALAPISLAFKLGLETGSVKDLISGMLGKGVGRVRGTVKEKSTPNIPVFKRVRLIREKDGLVVREQWSNALTGTYDFQFVDELQVFTVVTYDHLHNFRAVIADNLVPELMPELAV